MVENVPLSSEKFPDCSIIGGNSKSLFLRLKSGQNTPVPPCSPLDKTKRIWEKSEFMGGGKKEKSIYIYNNRKKGGTGEQTGTNPDPRFKSKVFRESVRLVLISLGLEPNFKHFRQYDQIIDWRELAQNLRHPRPEFSACSCCGREEDITVEIVATGKVACLGCWKKVQDQLREAISDQEVSQEGANNDL